ncbi:MAG: 1-acyl-sn-glycerol-3-phosphate acyltransferase [Alloprevotella sp.]|nr:1-acyl-sn-glycerol-3-phosphate acyltransferase [Alloprevotella sp.]
MTWLYFLYQLLIALPLGLLLTLLVSIVIIVGCLFNAHFWGYWPAHFWARAVCRLLLLRVKVRGREHLHPRQSYVFVANHQGAMDIFLVYGYLNRNFKWMMKKALRRMPVVGYACQKARHIFVDKSGPRAIQRTYDSARRTLRGGTSLVVFPEGARTFTGHMGVFRKGAFQLADELGLAVVPMTINGSFDVLPRQRGFFFVRRHTLELVIHAPLPYDEDTDRRARAYNNIMSALPDKYQGYVENRDQ